MCEARGREFKSQIKRIFCVNFEGLGTGCFTRYQRLSLWYHFGGTSSKNRYQRLLATGALSRFSSSVLSPSYHSFFCLFIARGSSFLQRLSALVILYTHPLKRIFLPSHRDSLLYISFLCTRRTL